MKSSNFLVSLALLVISLLGITTVLISLDRSQETRSPAQEASPSPSPSPSPLPSVCDLPQPPQLVKARAGANPGEVLVSWTKSDNASYYSVTYGPKSGQYQWGAPNIGDIQQFTIRGLDPGATYYIVLSAVNACGGSAYSPEASGVAGGQVSTPSSNLQPEIVIYNSPTYPSPSPSPRSEAQTLSPEPVEGSKGSSLWKNPFLLGLAGLFLIIALSQLLRLKIGKTQPLAGPSANSAAETPGASSAAAATGPAPEVEQLSSLPETPTSVPHPPAENTYSPPPSI